MNPGIRIGLSVAADIMAKKRAPVKRPRDLRGDDNDVRNDDDDKPADPAE